MIFDKFNGNERDFHGILLLKINVTRKWKNDYKDHEKMSSSFQQIIPQKNTLKIDPVLECSHLITI